MTDDEWAGCCWLMEQAFKGDMDPDKRRAYRVFLGDFEPGRVECALRALAELGDPWLPTAPEIVAACRGLERGSDVPSWSEAYRLLLRALGAGASVAGYFAPPREKEERASAWLEAMGAPLVARFLESETYERLCVSELDDPDFGHLRRLDLEARWREFCVTAGRRLARGRALGLGPRSLDAAAVLVGLRPAGELGSGA